jgi:hypothetical protein
VSSRWTRAVLALVALAALAGGYELLAGWPRRVEGRWVRRVTVWHAYGLGLPIPYQRGTLYHVYTGPAGGEVRHGPFRTLHGNGRLATRGAYRHGRPHGTWTTWSHRGQMTSAEFWADGDHRGWAIYEAGRVHYHHERLVEGGALVGWKRFEGGRWFLAVPSGAPARFTIDPATGVLERVSR